MFFLLLFIGISLILIGVYKDKNVFYDLIIEKQSTFNINQTTFDDKQYTFAEIQERSDMMLRIKNLEDTVFNNDRLKEYEEVATIVETVEEINTPTNLFKSFELLCKYEDEDRSLEEICELLNMKKGEVLLLKNLHKNYQS